MTQVAKFSWLTTGLGLLGCLGAFTNDSFVPSLSLIAEGLEVDPGTVQLTMTGVLVGFLFGSMFHGPLSERFGRKPVLCASLAAYVVAGVVGATANSLDVVVAARMLQGFSVAAPIVLTRAIVLDRWTGAQASRVISWLGVFVFMAPIIAPLLGGYIASFGDWSAIFWFHAAVGAVALVLTILLLTRTHSACGGDLLSGVRAYRLIFRSPDILGYLLVSALAWTGMMTFISTSSFVFVSYYGLSPQMQGICFSIVMSGAALSSFFNSRLVALRGISTMIGFGVTCLGVGGALVLIACWTEVSPPLLVMSVMVYVFGIGFIFANTVARAMSHYRENAASVSSAFAASQYVFGIVVTAVLSMDSTPGLMGPGISIGVSGLVAAILWWSWLRHSSFTRYASENAA